ncbi:MAG: His/Gly/Thr/Pro-type tRNA ligase C-terminal domain-containing protein [bacterium]|nr:His/Gly/Thr/Pro-type tRNA ligase C-terminal domain-containing protein [bacterium]
MRPHPKDQTPRQKRFPLALKQVGLSKILTEEPAEFPVDSLVRVVSDLGFRQIIPAPTHEQGLFLNDQQLEANFGSKLLGIEARGDKKFVLPPTHFLNVFKKYLESLGEEGAKTTKWFYTSPVVFSDQNQLVSHEIGIFILGDDSVIANAHLIDGVGEMLKELGITNFALELNSLGCQDCRREYQSLLSEHFGKSSQDLCGECAGKLEAGQFTMWSCEKSRCKELLAVAPQIVDFLDDTCRTNLIGVLEAIDTLGIPYSLNPLLSGKISHERIFFRVISAETNDVLGEGANFAPWAKYLGRDSSVPLLTFMTTFEKLLPFIPIERQKARLKVDVFLISLGEVACRKALVLRKNLRSAGISSLSALLGHPGIKNQLKEAVDHSSEIALIVGQKEAMDETVILRDMRSGMQEIFSLDRIIEEVKKRLG